MSSLEKITDLEFTLRRSRRYESLFVSLLGYVESCDGKTMVHIFYHEYLEDIFDEKDIFKCLDFVKENWVKDEFKHEFVVLNYYLNVEDYDTISTIGADLAVGYTYSVLKKISEMNYEWPADALTCNDLDHDLSHSEIAYLSFLKNDKYAIHV
jgi:hypothetical protein